MIQQQTIIEISDNSGGKTAKCLKLVGGFKKKFAFIGDIIIVSIQTLRNKTKIISKVQKGEIYKAIILTTKHNTKRKDNIYTIFNKNCICLLNKQDNLLGTRITGPISAKLKGAKYQKIISISRGTV